MENGVFATRRWKTKEEWTLEYLQRNIGVYILIDDEEGNNPVKMKQKFQI